MQHMVQHTPLYITHAYTVLQHAPSVVILVKHHSSLTFSSLTMYLHRYLHLSQLRGDAIERHFQKLTPPASQP